MPEKNKNLYYLDELSDYKIASDYCDVRGWEVIDADSRTIGVVDHLLVNKEAERVVYLDVEIDNSLIEDGHNTFQLPVSEGVHEFINKDGANHLIIPIGMANLDEKNKRVTTNQIDSSTFARAQRFKKGDIIDFGYELNVLRHFTGDHTVEESTSSGKQFYDRKEFDISKIRNT